MITHYQIDRHLGRFFTHHHAKERFVVYLLAHHTGHLLEKIDFLGLEPESTLDHVLAFGAYGLLFSVLVGAGFGTKLLARRGRATNRGVDPKTS
ncbi:hypothetical protein [Tautonia rosea]|uniref:hypothetical protein n=1 Tax=Tautonia rosea TaxID=2728037 RepID=UPI00147457B8|nr:hypothetical protein [Tautonia rosea]